MMFCPRCKVLSHEKNYCNNYCLSDLRWHGLMCTGATAQRFPILQYNILFYTKLADFTLPFTDDYIYLLVKSDIQFFKKPLHDARFDISPNRRLSKVLYEPLLLDSRTLMQGGRNNKLCKNLDIFGILKKTLKFWAQNAAYLLKFSFQNKMVQHV